MNFGKNFLKIHQVAKINGQQCCHASMVCPTLRKPSAEAKRKPVQKAVPSSAYKDLCINITFAKLTSNLNTNSEYLMAYLMKIIDFILQFYSSQ